MDKRHFIQVIDQHRGTIRSLCQVYYATPEDQKDAFQDIVLQLWKSFDSFEGKSQINTWIYRVGLNTLLSKKRKEQPSTSFTSIDGYQQLLQTSNSDDDLELLHQVIQTLKDVDKAMVVLHLEGYKNKEIANMLDLSTSNVATRFNRIKAQLKSRFNTHTYATKRP
ncbi:MAG: sigma-70 family RNA polymerase sigma factor [Cytophagales bacterium]|nr:sigma-70 family RNA polymerase sigma factor [Cytophagales bacterium]